MARRSRWRAAGPLVLAAAVLAGCAPRRAGPPAPPPGVVDLTGPTHTLGLLPLYVGLARAAPTLTVDWTPDAALSLTDHAAKPVTGFLLIRSDLVLLSPVANPDFRWRDLRGVPLTATDATAADERLVATVLAEHGVRDAITPLGWAEARRWFQGGRLPYLLAPLLPALALVTHNRGAVLAYVGAATPPMPRLLLAGRSPQLARLLAALNAGLGYLTSHPPAAVALLVRHDYPGVAPGVLAEAIGTLDGLGAWPPTVYPARGVYQNAEALMGPAQWPPYSAVVDPAPAAAALGTPTAAP